jgi:hypothetical protein
MEKLLLESETKMVNDMVMWSIIDVTRSALTRYSVSQGELVFARWKDLATDIFTKFNDGYIRGADGSYPREGDPYPDEWLRRVVDERPEQFKLPVEFD